MRRHNLWVVLLLVPLGVHASDVGTTSANFLTVPVSARAVGMGEAFVAVADDLGSLYWNPAGLARLERKQVSFLYNSYLQDVTFQNAAFGIPFESGALGANLTYVGYGDFEGFGVDGGNNPVAIGSPHAQSSAMTIGGAWNFFERVSVGLNVKHIHEKLADTSASTVAGDLGATAEWPTSILGGRLRTGLSVRNLGAGLQFIDQRAPLPTDMKVGFALVKLLNNRLNTALDFGKRRDDKLNVSAGAEYWVIPQVALRTGWAENHTEGLGVRAGLGLRVGSFGFDYAYAGFGNLGLTHRYEVSFQFGDKRIVLTAEDKKLLEQARGLMDNGDYEKAFEIYDQMATKYPGLRDARDGMKLALDRIQSNRLYMVADQKKQIDPTLDDVDEAELRDLQALLDVETPRSAEVQMLAPAEGVAQ